MAKVIYSYTHAEAIKNGDLVAATAAERDGFPDGLLIVFSPNLHKLSTIEDRRSWLARAFIWLTKFSKGKRNPAEIGIQNGKKVLLEKNHEIRTDDALRVVITIYREDER